MKKRMNNKGFSLVELIVVIAIMAILAVTLAPKLTHYIDKAKQASDQEVINTIYQAAKLSLADQTIYDDFLNLASDETGNIQRFGFKSTSDGDASSPMTLYTSSDGKTWIISSGYNYLSNKFPSEINTVVGNFKLKSNTTSSTDIIIELNTTTNKLSVFLDYNGNEIYDSGTDYIVTE